MPGTLFHRLHPLRDAHQLTHFGRGPEGRLNAPGGEYGVLYAALDPHAAFVETFGRDLGVRVVTRESLGENLLVELRVTRPLALVTLSGPSLQRLGSDARVTTGDYRVAQRWALALWRHPQTPDGLYWRSRFDNDRYCVALFDRCRNALEPRDLGTLGASPNRALLGAMLDTYGFAPV